MTYCSVSVALHADSNVPERDVQPLADILRRNITAAADDFMDSHKMPRGTVLVLNGEVVPIGEPLLREANNVR